LARIKTFQFFIFFQSGCFLWDGFYRAVGFVALERKYLWTNCSFRHIFY